jgi:hypothetical protein
VYLSAGKQYDFADHGDKRLVSVWRSPGDYISIANGCRSLLARILKFRNSRHFDGSQVGRAYSSLLRLAYAVERGSSENDLIETNRMLKFVWAWIKRNRKEFIWRKGEPHPKSYGGVWHKHGLFIGLRPHALAEVAESLGVEAPRVRYLLRRAGIIKRRRITAGPYNTIFIPLEFKRFREAAIAAGVPAEEIDSEAS